MNNQEKPLSLRDQIVAEFGLDLSNPADQRTLEKMLQAATSSDVQNPSGSPDRGSSVMTDKTAYLPRSNPRKTGY